MHTPKTKTVGEEEQAIVFMRKWHSWIKNETIYSRTTQQTKEMSNTDNTKKLT